MDKYVKNLKIIYFFSLISLPVLFAFFYITKDPDVFNENMIKVFRYVVTIIGAIGIPSGFMYYKSKLASISNESSDTRQLISYRKITIIRLVSIMIPAIFAIHAYKLTHDNVFCIYLLIFMAFFGFIYPSENKIKNELNLGDVSNLDLESVLETEKKPVSKTRNIIAIGIEVSLIALSITMTIMYPDKRANTDAQKINIKPVKLVDGGTVINGTYYHNYLNWTFKLPEGYEVAPISDDVSVTGEDVINNSNVSGGPKVVKLLHIYNDKIEFAGFLYPRILVPSLKSVDQYLEVIDKKMESLTNNVEKTRKTGSGFLSINKREFKYSEYNINRIEGQRICLDLVRFNKDYILEFGIFYKDSVELKAFLNILQASDFKWK